MNNFGFSNLSAKDQQEVFFKIGKLKYEQNWQSELDLLELILKDENIITRKNRQLWYERAIALDMLLRPSEAIAVLNVLVEIYPLHHLYAHSLIVTCMNLGCKAIELFKDDKENKDVEVYVVNILKSYYCPWALTELYLDHLLLTQQTEKAKKIIEDYINLSPFDFNFLEKALKIAEFAGDSLLLQKCLSRIQLGLSFHPCNDELTSLLAKYFNTSEQEAS